MGDLILRVDGIDHGGWLAVSITAGIERMARDFRLGVTDVWPGSAASRRIRPGDRCEVLIGDEPVLTGWVDATPISYDARSVNVGAAGRSLTADLVDCSAEHASGQWRNAKLERIAADLVEPFGLSVTADTDTGEPLRAFQIERGESVQQAIDRLIGQRALLATDDAVGNLVITRAGTEHADDPLVLGSNVLACSAEIDHHERFSEYRVIGQRSGTDTDYGAPAATAANTATDPEIKRHRPLLIHMEGQATPAACRERALWTAAYRRGRSYALSYSVPGWQQSSGALWQPNQMVQVEDSAVGIAAEMLIVEVTYRLDAGGEICELSIMPKSAFEKLPEIPEAEAKATKTDGAKSSVGSPGLVRPGETITGFD